MPFKKDQVTRQFGKWKAHLLRQFVKGATQAEALERYIQHRRDLGSAALRQAFNFYKNSQSKGDSKQNPDKGKQKRSVVDQELEDEFETDFIEEEGGENQEQQQNISDIIPSAQPHQDAPMDKPSTSKRMRFDEPDSATFDNQTPSVYETVGSHITPREDVISETPVQSNPNNGGAAGGGGGAGGIGSANNTFFKGFGKPDKRSGLKTYSVRKRYEKPTMFSSEHSNDRSCKVLTGSAYHWKTAGLDHMVKATFNHDGRIIPYFYREASLDSCDWNVGDNCVGYKIHEFGCYTTNMRIVTRPNDK